MEENKAPRQDYLPGCCYCQRMKGAFFRQTMLTKKMGG